MIASRRDEWLEGMREDKARLEAELEQLRGQMESVQAELDRLERAMAALEGEAQPKAPRRKRTGKGSRAGASAAEVRTHATALLKERGKATLEELRTGVGERVAAAGKTRQGLHITLPKVLKGKGFVEAEGQWQLATSPKG